MDNLIKFEKNTSISVVLRIIDLLHRKKEPNKPK
jgi:hypothetical protein